MFFIEADGSVFAGEKIDENLLQKADVGGLRFGGLEVVLQKPTRMLKRHFVTSKAHRVYYVVCNETCCVFSDGRSVVVGRDLEDTFFDRRCSKEVL